MIRTLLLAACIALPATAQAQEKVTIALDWVLNTNHVGLIAARERGLYSATGRRGSGFCLYDLTGFHERPWHRGRHHGVMGHDAA